MKIHAHAVKSMQDEQVGITTMPLILALCRLGFSFYNIVKYKVSKFKTSTF